MNMTGTMLVTRFDRKAALARQGITFRDIATEAAVDESLVSHVVAGRRLTGPQAKQVMEVVARRMGSSVSVVFPEAAA